MVEYYLAANYSPLASGCTNSFGEIDPGDFSCCQYFTCDSPQAVNYGYLPNVTSFFIPIPSLTVPPDLNTSQNLANGCVSNNYDITLGDLDNADHFDFEAALQDDTISNFPESWAPVPGSNWCCAYDGCPDPTARNFTEPPLWIDGESIATEFYLGCNVDDYNLNTWNIYYYIPLLLL